MYDKSFVKTAAANRHKSPSTFVPPKTNLEGSNFRKDALLCPPQPIRATPPRVPTQQQPKTNLEGSNFRKDALPCPPQPIRATPPRVSTQKCALHPVKANVESIMTKIEQPLSFRYFFSTMTRAPKSFEAFNPL